MSEELNRKLAEWAGFTEADIKKHYYWEIGGERCAKWLEPNTTYHIKLPNFTLSLDACFKWPVPLAIAKYCQLKIEFETNPYPLCRIYAWGTQTIDHATLSGWTLVSEVKAGLTNSFEPASLLAEAIEQLIDKEEKDESR